MTFLTTGLAVAGACAVAIPILIHLLFRRRRKPIEWAAMRFLLEAFRKHKRRLQLEQLLLLVVRSLIVLLLGAALARPILEQAGLLDTGGSRAVYIILDDGLISSLTHADGQTALETHVEAATELINSLDASDAVGVLTASSPARAMLIPPSTNHAAVIDLLNSINPKLSPTDFPGAMTLIRPILDEAKTSGRRTLVYLFSEFRHGSGSLDNPLPAILVDADDPITLLASTPATDVISNIQVVSLNPVRRVFLPGTEGGSDQIAVRIKRVVSSHGLPGNQITRIKLEGAGLPPVEPQTVIWQPGQTEADIQFMVNLSSFSNQELALSAVIDNDSLAADNSRHTVLDLRNRVRVLLIDRRTFGIRSSIEKLTAGDWIRLALEPAESSPIEVVQVEPAAVGLADVRTADVIFVPRPDLLLDSGWDALREFAARDGLIVFMPPADLNVHPWVQHFKTQLNLNWTIPMEVAHHETPLPLAEIQPASELLRLLASDLPDLAQPVLSTRTLSIRSEEAHIDRILNFADGTPLLIAGIPSAGSFELEPTGNKDSLPQPRNPAIATDSIARGFILYLAVAPELSWTNLPGKPLMVPLCHEIIRQGLSIIRGSQDLDVGVRPTLAHYPQARDVVDPQGKRLPLEENGRVAQPLDHTGFYHIHDPADQLIGKVAVNIQPDAASTEINTHDAVQEWLAAAGPWHTAQLNNSNLQLAPIDHDSHLAGLLLVLVLALAFTETLLARWFSHAYRAADVTFGRSRPAAFGGRASLDTSSHPTDPTS